jgi:hypothetical protein
MKILTNHELSMVSGGAEGYWMENYTGEYNWIPTNSSEFSAHADKCFVDIASTEAGIHFLDSCDGGDGYSNGGCYKWE